MSKTNVIPLSHDQFELKSQWSAICSDLIVKRGDARIIQGVSCRISMSGITVIMGPNGAGKSVLLKSIAGLIEPDSGYVQLHPDLAGRTSMVFQQPVLLRRSVKGNLVHALRIARVPSHMRNKRIEELLSAGGLQSATDRPAKSLSGGEQQRLQMIRALSSDPQLLLMDEPTANLDPQSTMTIETLIETALDKRKTIIVVTHDVGQARRIADEVIFLHNGRIVEQGPAKKVLKRPDSNEVRAYLDGKLLI